MVQRGGRRPAKYRQIAADLRARIERGDWPVDAQMPTQPELSVQYSAALGTIDKALGVLRELGIAETVQGMGTFVRKPSPSEDGDLAAQLSRLSERIEVGEDRTDELGHRVDEQQQLLVGIKREVQDHARLLARMRRRLEEAGITLADAEQRDEQAM
jgi:DNA-binding GntR family transcriptional regulator